MEEAAAAAIPFKNLHSREYQNHKKKGDCVAWNCTGTKLASGSVDQTARVWQIEPHGHDDELTILDVRKFKPIHKRKFNYEIGTFYQDKTRFRPPLSSSKLRMYLPRLIQVV